MSVRHHNQLNDKVLCILLASQQCTNEWSHLLQQQALKSCDSKLEHSRNENADGN